MEIKFIIHENKTFWGKVWHIIGNDGMSYLKVSYEKDDPGVLYLNSLSVYPSVRGNGRGIELLREAEKLGRSLKDINCLQLCVEKPGEKLVKYYENQDYKVIDKDSEYIYLLKTL